MGHRQKGKGKQRRKTWHRRNEDRKSRWALGQPWSAEPDLSLSEPRPMRRNGSGRTR